MGERSKTVSLTTFVAGQKVLVKAGSGIKDVADLAGLISPEVIPFIRDEARLFNWLQTQGAHYLVTFPGWYPQLVTK